MLLVDYAEAQLVRTYQSSAPGLYVIYPAFTVRNVGGASATVSITNLPDQTTPLGYITFRPHSESPPTEQGDKVLTRILGVGESLDVDIIVDTNGLTVAGTA